MSRLPIRWRMTLAFSLAMLVVLVAVGAFIYLRFADDLERSLDRGLRVRSAEVSALVTRSPDATDRLATPAPESDESVAQVLGPGGAIRASTSGVAVPLLGPADLRRAGAGPLVVNRPGDADIDEDLRLLATPVTVAGERVVVVVGASRDENREALASLLVLELAGLVAALVVTGVVGHLVGGVALRPLEEMRRRAEEISDRPDLRLPPPGVDDELGRLAVTLNAMLDRLGRAAAAERAAIATERRFVADASHELRTPLTILKSEVEVALMDGRTPAELEAALASVGEETDRLCRLAEDLLVLAQADDGHVPVRLGDVDAGELLRTVAARERRRAASAGRALSVSAPDDLRLHADRSHLERALGDLVNNALRHGAGAIELGAGRGADGPRLWVRDEGAGFPADFRDRAFERFSRADPGRGGDGAGLGLALVQAVARAHGGRASVHDAHPGACVRISLPEARPGVMAAEGDTRVEHGIGWPASGHPGA